MGKPAERPATYDDVLHAPPNKVAEIVEGELILSPRPAGPHAAAATALAEELGPPFKRGRGGPGGWILLLEPELHLGAHILVPDLVNPLQHTLEVLQLSAETPGQWLSLGAFGEDAHVRGETFEVFDLDLSILWQDVRL